MSDRERHANASLRALADAYAQGSIDRQAYRARRRRVLRALIEHEDVTRPSSPAPAADPSDNEESVTLLLASRRGIPGPWRVLGLMAAAAALVVAVAYWMLEQGNG